MALSSVTDTDISAPPHADMANLDARERELHDLSNEPYSGTRLQDHEKDARVFQIAFTAIDEVRRLRKLAVRADDASTKKTRLGLLVTIVVGVLSAGAMASSCANSGINYRQMRAIEIIADHAKDCHP